MNNILIVGVGMSQYNEFRLRRLVGGLRAAEFGVECWGKGEIHPMEVVAFGSR